MNKSSDTMSEITKQQQEEIEKKNKKKQALQTHSVKRNKKTNATKSKPVNAQPSELSEKPKQKQQKLDNFMFIANSNQNSKQLDSYVSIPNQMQLKITNLQQDLNKKINTIEKLQMEKDSVQQKYSSLYQQKKRYTEKSKKIITQNMRQIATMRRKQKGQIDFRLGYYKQGSFKQFVQGDQIKKLKSQLSKKQKVVKKLQQQKQRKSLSVDNKDNISLAILFHQKDLNEIKQKIINKEYQLERYKQRLRLSQKQNRSKYAQQDWPIVNDRFMTMELLGSGGFGQVYKCFDLETNQTVALKINKWSLNRSQQQIQEFKKHIARQVHTQQKLNHPNIAKFIQMLEFNQGGMSFILEYCQGPQLSNYLKRHKSLQQRQAKQIVKQILRALVYLSNLEPKVIHYDLKPSNIMFHNGLIKILDFGLCKHMDNDQTKMQLTSQGVGTYWYLPPETFAQNLPVINNKVDIWSVGVIFFQLLYGRRPFGHGMSQNKIYNEGTILKATQVDFPNQTPKKHKVSESAKQFIRSCLKYHMDERLSPQQALNHSYLKK